MNSRPALLPTGSDWSFDAIVEYDREIGRVAESFGLDTYPNQIEIISAEQMMDAYASNGMPMICYFRPYSHDLNDSRFRQSADGEL